MPFLKKQSKSSRIIIRVIAATCFLLIIIVTVFFATRYQTTPKFPPSDTTQIPPIKEPTRTWQYQLQEADRQLLIAQGLQNPVADLVQDLMKHNELIPCKGSVGGTPGFYSAEGITVLSKNRVRADYDDGHVMGTAELTFTVSNGAISWKVKRTECGN